MPWPMRFGPPPSTMIFLRVGRLGLALLLVGRVHVGGVRRELGGAGVDALVDRAHAERVARARAPRARSVPQQVREAAVGEALALQVAQLVGSTGSSSARPRERHLDVDELLDLRQEPRVDRASRSKISSSVMPMRNASPTYQMRSGPGVAELVDDLLAVGRCARSKPSTPVSRPRSAFCKHSWKVRPIAITSPTDFICVVRRGRRPGTSRTRSAGSW